MMERERLSKRALLLAVAAGAVIALSLWWFTYWAFAVPMDPLERNPPVLKQTFEETPSDVSTRSAEPVPPGPPPETP